MTDYLKKDSKEKKESWVEVEFRELDQALEDIKERMAEFEEQRKGEEQKENKDKAAVEEMRRQATEKLSETKKREAPANLEDQDLDEKSPPGKKKKSTSVVDVVQETIELEKWQQECNDEERAGSQGFRAATATNVSAKSSTTATTISTTTASTEHVNGGCNK